MSEMDPETTITEPESAPPPAQDSAPASNDAPEFESSGDETQDGDGQPNRREARYRVRAREAEAKAAALAERVQKYQRAEAERIAGQKLGKGSDLWSGGVQLSDLLTEDGELDAELVAAAVSTVIEDHPHWRRAGAPPASTVTSDGKIGGTGAPSFIDAFKPRRS